jgi:hypothetical protein
MTHVLFREFPPWEIVVQILNMLNISTHFPTTFQRSDLIFDRAPEAIMLLRPYYKPCKARQYLEDVPEQRWITLLRHILMANGYEMKSQETTRNKKKAILYTIQKVAEPTSENIVVEFS